MRGVLRRRLVLALAIVALSGFMVLVPAPAAAITVTVPYSVTPVATGDLDGNPATGAWDDVTPLSLPLENGEGATYGSVSFYAKHDGTNVYFRVDGKIDVLWESNTGNHFWFGMQISSSGTTHHVGSGWDGVFFGESFYTSTPPLVPVDTNGFTKNPPPAKDTTQNDLGRMQASGTGAPYSFTAEWMRKLNTGDASDIVFAADGTTPYNFFATTDSDGGGSGGGAINHKVATNNNVIRFAAVPAGDNTPPTVTITAPTNGATVSGAVLVSATATDDPGGSGVASVTFFIDSTSAAVDTAPPYEYSWDTTAVANGAHTVRADAKDVAGNTGTNQITVTVSNADTTAPVAVAGPDQAVPPGTTVTFDGSASTDNVGITDYTWSFTDGGAKLLSGLTAQYTFNNVGNFLVTLTAKDAAGNTGTDTLWVNVTADTAPPVARAGPDQAVFQGALVTLNGSQSTDDVAIANYTWTLTDGGSVTLYGPVAGRRFFNLGSFQVMLAVRDFVGKTSTDTLWVNVTADPIPPVARACADHLIQLGESVTLDGTNSTDDVIIVNYTWTVQDASTILYGPIVTYTPTSGGIYHVVLAVFDASHLSSSDTVNVTVVAPDRTAPAAVAGLVAATSGPGSVILTWSPNTEPDLAGYIVYRFGPDGVPIRLNELPLANATYVDSGLEPGQSYRYIVEAVDSSANLSMPSNEVTGSAGLYPPEPFDWMSIRWTLIPGATALALVVLALLAQREDRRRRRAPIPPPPSQTLPPPPEVKP